MIPETKVEVISQKENKYFSKIMTITEWKNIKKKKGYIYRSYQIGYYQNKNKIKL